MPDVDWTTVLSYLIGGSGTLTLVAVAWIQSRKRSHPKEVEDRAAAESNTYAAPGADTVTGLISLANEVGNLSRKVAADGAKLEAMSLELKDVKRELGMFRRSYIALYWWSQQIITDWELLRESADPPDLPPDIHHP